MSHRTTDRFPYQEDLFETEGVRSLLDQLLSESRLYTQSKDYQDLLEFVVRLRNFAPFNAMLLHVQKPGLSYAASARDWRERFGRMPKESARPLVILWPFGPVALVYDVMDTEGEPLPEDVASFFGRGVINENKVNSFASLLYKKNIEWSWVDAGDQKAGLIYVVKRGSGTKEPTRYRIQINRNHSPAVQFATLAHELGHLFLGHLGSNRILKVPERPRMARSQEELEAESVAYLVCARNGATSKSETYLSNYVGAHTTVDEIDLYQIMRAAGQVEALLGLTTPPSVRRAGGSRRPPSRRSGKSATSRSRSDTGGNGKSTSRCPKADSRWGAPQERAAPVPQPGGRAGPAEFFEDPDRLLEVVTRLTDLHEQSRAEPWAVTDAPPSFVRAQLKGIVGPAPGNRAHRGQAQHEPESERRGPAGVATGLAVSDRASERATAELIPT